jgi:hypothetical protein
LLKSETPRLFDLGPLSRYASPVMDGSTAQQGLGTCRCLTTPLEDAQGTTPHGAPRASGETPPELPAGSLHSLSQRHDILAELGRGSMGIVW